MVAGGVASAMVKATGGVVAHPVTKMANQIEPGVMRIGNASVRRQRGLAEVPSVSLWSVTQTKQRYTQRMSAALLVFAFTMSTAADAAPPAADAPAAVNATHDADTDLHDADAMIADAVDELLVAGQDVVRVAVTGLDDVRDSERAPIERAVVHAILQRRREEVVTPELLRARLNAQAEAQTHGISIEALKPYACDHVLSMALVSQGATKTLNLKLVSAQSGAVLSQASVPIGAATHAASASATSARVAVQRLSELLAYGVESTGRPVKSTRIGVPTLSATPGAAQDGRVDRFVSDALSTALVRRGFVVVDRVTLSRAVEQAAIGQALGEHNAPQVGKLAGADALVIGQVSEAGTAFIVNVRLVDTSTGAVIAAGSERLPRDNVLARADVETRTSAEAAMRSAVAPGWGQAYNGEGVKALAFAIAGYGGALTTVGLAVGSGFAWLSYQNVRPSVSLSAQQAGVQAVQLRQLANGLLWGTAAAATLTGIAWGGAILDAALAEPTAEGGA